MKYIHKTTLILLSLFALTLFFTSCDTTDSNGGNGKFVVKLTDAPALYDAVYIDIKSVQVKAIESSDSTGKNSGWITLNKDSMRVNLLDLQNGKSILLGKHRVKAGFYHQIRLILGDDNTIEINGISFPLKTPSAQQSGLKLNVNAKVEANEVYVLLIDFDAAKSIVETGNGDFILKPVLHVVDLSETGSIEGTVKPDSVQTKVSTIVNGDTVTTTTGDGGSFKLIGVLQGTYDITFNPESEAYSDTTVTGVSVGLDEDVDLGTITLSQK